MKSKRLSRGHFTLLLSASASFFSPTPSLAAPADQKVAHSASFHAFAPNAGGQSAYALRRTTSDREMSVFVNESLTVSGFPLVGALYSWHFPLCGPTCIADLYADFGFGLSAAGPVVAANWGLLALWVARVDFSLHAFFVPNRAILWSYPLWLGVSVPF